MARAASLAVRRAKAAARRAKESLSGKDGKKARENVKEKLDGYVEAAIDAYVDEYGRQPTTDAEIAEAEEMSGMPEAYRTNGEPISEEALIDRILERGDEADEPAGEPLDEEPVYTTPGFPSDGGGTQDGAGDNDNWGWFLDEGLAGMSGDSIAEMAGEVAAKVAGGGELSELEQSFAEALTQKAAGLVEKVWRGERLTDEEKVIIQSLKGVVKPPAVANRGWTDAARRASLAVRQAKAAARKARESGDAGQSAVSGEQSAVSGEDGGNETPVPPEGGGQEDGFAEKRSQMAAEIEDWYRRAYDAFVEKKGREPLSDEDVIEAEELAGVPEKYRTGGDDVQALVVADQVLWDQEEKERGESPEGSGEVANVGWTDAARRAALAVRRAKAAARKAREVGGGEHERAGTPVPPGGDEGETKDDYNPHWPVYRRPVIQPRGEPGEATMPPEFRRPPPGRPIPIYKLFRRENVDKLRRGEGR